MPTRDTSVSRWRRPFNEAAGVDPADARRLPGYGGYGGGSFNEAAGVDPADAAHGENLAVVGPTLQ